MDKSTKELLAQAEKLCAQRNVRLTPQRLEVLRLMSLQQGAISAYDLLDLLRESEPQAKPPTVYRALDFLLEQGFVHKVESTNSYVLCHLFDQPTHTSAMFICDRCGVVKEEAAEGVEDIMHTLAARMGFALRHNVIEAHGLCSACVEVEACRHQDECQHDHSILVKKSRVSSKKRRPEAAPVGYSALPAVIVAGFPVFDFVFRLIFRVAVTFLNFTDKLIALTFNDGHIVIRQLTPLFFRFTFELLPVAADFVFIHHRVLLVKRRVVTSVTFFSAGRDNYCS
jgi:Fur family zinc uptake transcriptional regulator